MGACIAIGAVNLYAGFTSFLYLQLKKKLRPGDSIVHCSTGTQDDTGVARERLLGLLGSGPRPAALIAICLRPGPAVIDAYRRVGAPVIVIDEAAEGASTVAADNAAGARMAIEHLLQRGRRSIAMVSGRAGLVGGFTSLQRQQGVRQALASAGLALADENLIEVPDYSEQDGVSAMNAFLSRTPRIDAVFCGAGDTTAVGMLEAAKARGVKVPDDVAVLSCDDLPVAAIVDPPLTTIRQPLDDIASEALRLAVEEAGSLLVRPRSVLLPPTLVRRQSA
jgi:DNA-binding LacI/PurR family transcriptional regulator